MAEILGWMVPLMQELGIDARWEVITGPPEFYRVTKAFHNGLQGLPVSLGRATFDLHYEVNRENAQRLNLEADVVFVHDPQPIYLPAVHAAGAGGPLDLALPHRRLAARTARSGSTWRRPSPTTRRRSSRWPAFTRPLACPMFLIPPSIDPLSRQELPDSRDGAAGDACRGWASIPARPLLLQVSRFDRFKDPLGRDRGLSPAANRTIPDLQLALAGGPADDDPEGAEVLREVMDRAGDDNDLKVLMLPPDSHRTINALQRSAIVVCRSRSRRASG